MSNAVPEGWVIATLNEFASVKGGKRLPKGKTFSSAQTKYPYVRVTDFKSGSVDTSRLRYVSESIRNQIKRYVISSDDLYISIAGTLGLVGEVPEVLDGALLTENAAKIVFNSNSNKTYFKYYLNSNEAQEHFNQAKGTGGGVPKLALFRIEDTLILCPPLPEQQKIATILTSVDEVIEKTQAQIDKLKDLKTAMMQTLLTNGVGTKPASADAALNNRTACRESCIPHTEFKDSPVGRIPKSWEVVTLRDVVIAKGLQTGPFGSQLHAHEYVENGVPVVMPKNMKSNRVSCKGIAQITAEKAATLSKHKVLSGDILFSRRGDIGRFALVEDVNEGSICGTGCLKARLNDSMSSSFFAAYLTLEYVVEWLINNSVGQTMLNLNTSILAALPVLKPPLEEQNKISSVITSIDMSITLKERKLLAQQNTKKALMQDLLTGKVRVKVD
jgi:type I restriction enzyme S subunit